MKRAIIFQGGWDGHEPVLVSALFKAMLEKEGVTTEVYDNQDCLADAERLAGADLIVPVWTMGEISGEYVKNISRAVENGTGLAGCHGGMCDAFRQDVDWQFMTGSQWVAHPGNDGTEYTVDLVGGGIFTKGLKAFKVKSEQYYIHVDPAVQVYATTRFPVADGPHAANGPVDVPVVYTKMWGKGRVFYNSLGHHADVFDIPEAREIMRRGLLWAARQEESLL